MKKISIVATVIIILFAACRKDRFGKLATSVITVQAKYPSTYSNLLASGANITITNTTDGSTKTATTNSNGAAIFSDMLPGTYNITANKSLTAAEALALTGISSAVNLNGIQNAATVSGNQNTTFDIQLAGGAVGGFVIKEVYYTASRTPSNGTYFSDQFIEIYNNATDTLYLDSLCIADAHGNSGLINPTSLPSPFSTDNSSVYVNSVWQFPGTGREYPVAPGGSVIIAQDGVNHQEALLNPNSPVNLANAEWETYNERPDNRDADAPAVPNMRRVYFTGGFDWLITVFGPGIILYKADFASLQQVPIPGATPTTLPRIKIPNAAIIDAFEALKDGSSNTFKRITVGLDAGFVFATDTYNKQSFRRRTATIINGRRVLQDNNNSTTDFERLNTPTPKSFQ